MTDYLKNQLINIKIELQRKGALINTTDDLIQDLLIFYENNKDLVINFILERKL